MALTYVALFFLIITLICGPRINDKLEAILKSVGIKVGRQNYTYHSAGDVYTGENVYGILQAPRGDATEAIVFVAPWKTVEAKLNRNGVALALTLARYFKRELSPHVLCNILALRTQEGYSGFNSSCRLVFMV